MYRYVWKIKLNDDVKEEDFLRFWRDSSSIIQEYPGAKGTHMHKVRGEDRTYLAIAEWESIEARDAMRADIEAGESDRSKRWLQFPKNDEWGEISIRAGVEEIDVVWPQK